MDRPEWTAGRPEHRARLPHPDQQHRAPPRWSTPRTRASRTPGATSSGGRRPAATTPRRRSRGTSSCSPARARGGRRLHDRRRGRVRLPRRDLGPIRDGRVWIQTDGTQPVGANDQMLAANPYVTDAEGAPELRRFLTGVIGSECTGVITTPDQRTMFVNIQHPGENGGSTVATGRRHHDARARRPSSSPRTTAASSAPDRRERRRWVLSAPVSC